MLNTPECITTDILVIGGGSSGLWTAKGAKEADPNADVLIVAGTSLTTQPAASFIDYFRGKQLVVINKEETPADDRATLAIRGDVSEIFARLSAE